MVSVVTNVKTCFSIKVNCRNLIDLFPANKPGFFYDFSNYPHTLRNNYKCAVTEVDFQNGNFYNIHKIESFKLWKYVETADAHPIMFTVENIIDINAGYYKQSSFVALINLLISQIASCNLCAPVLIVNDVFTELRFNQHVHSENNYRHVVFLEIPPFSAKLLGFAGYQRSPQWQMSNFDSENMRGASAADDVPSFNRVDIKTNLSDELLCSVQPSLFKEKR